MEFIFPFHCSLLVYRNAIDFCMLSLYLATLPSLLLVLIVSIVNSFGFSTYKMVSSVNSFTFAFAYLLLLCGVFIPSCTSALPSESVSFSLTSFLQCFL